MKLNSHNPRNYLYVFGVMVLAIGSVFGQKMAPDEIVAKHRESVGSIESRRNVKNQVASGVVQYTVLRNKTGGSGKIVIASEGNKTLMGMSFTIPSYPAETILFDGSDARVGFAISNARSEFGDFVYRYKDVVEEGLLGGVLTQGWALNDLSKRKARVSLDGLKEINGRRAYVLSYQPKSGSDLTIRIYIDQQTYEHVRTEYKRIISSIIGPNPDASASQREQRQTLVEDFSEYKREDGLNLPHAYRAYLNMEGAGGTREYEYKATFTDFYFNQTLDPASFTLAPR